MDDLTNKIYDKENCIYLSQCEDDFYYPEEQSVVSGTEDVSSVEPLPGPSTSTGTSYTSS